MIGFDDALATVLSCVQALPARTLRFDRALGMALAEDVVSRDYLPLFNSSAVDGYAVLVSDVADAGRDDPAALRFAGEIKAGDASRLRVRPGTALRILTGARVPAGADAVVMKEDTRVDGVTIRIFKSVPPGANIRRKGEELRPRDIALEKGRVVTPAVIGQLAALGRTSVRVHRRPRVGVLVTGNELRPPSASLQQGQIRDSNSFMLTAALRALGIEPAAVRRVRDTRAAVRRAIEELLSSVDVLVTSGGVSVGEYDFVREAFEACGVRERIWKIAIKPGKPNYFGTAGKRLVFGLPGNPVAALLSFHQFVRPAIERLMGAQAPAAAPCSAVLGADLRKKAGRLEFVRVRLAPDATGALEAVPTRGQESHMVGGIAAADGIYRFAREAEFVQQGSVVDVEPIRWSMI